MKTAIARIVTTISLALGTVLAAQAQTAPFDATLKLVNLDTPAVPGAGGTEARLDFRAFGGSEKQAYGGLDVNAGLGHGLSVLLRGTLSQTSTFNSPHGFSLRHGGDDIEGLIKYSDPSTHNWAIALGVAEPNTPAERGTFGVGELLYEFPTHEVNLYAGLKGVTGPNSGIAGLAGGFDVPFAEGLHLIGDVDFVFAGKTTYSSWSAPERCTIYGVAIRYTGSSSANSGYGIDLGITNGLGGSTGFSMTPSLGAVAGVYASLHFHF